MKRLLGFTRYVVLLGVAGNLIAAAIIALGVFGWLARGSKEIR
jgi:hypothetical protein